MNMNKQKEMALFWEDVFNPKGDDLVEVKAYLLAAKFLKQIEEALDEKNLKHKHLAEKINVSASYLSAFFNSNKLPNFKILAKIELALDIQFELMPKINNYNHYCTNSFTKKINPINSNLYSLEVA